MPRLVSAGIMLLLLLGGPALAQTDENDGLANYAFAVFTGTGNYRLDDRSIFVLRGNFRFGGREADHETGRFGYQFLLPAAIGFTSFDDLDELPELNDLKTISAAPGLELRFPLADNWQIKPFAQVGFGSELESGDGALVWGAGVRARAWYGPDRRWLIGGELLWAGNHPTNDTEPTTRFSRLGVGAEYMIPTQQTLFDRSVSWHIRALHWRYDNAADFEPPLQRTQVRFATELGVSIGLNPPLRILGMSFRQGGIGYEVADEYNAIKLFASFPF